LALEHGEIPPSLHYESPNPKIDFAAAPVYVNSSLAPWPERETPRRAGVDSFGLGGTNAHVVVEEAPTPEPALHTRPWQLLALAARTPEALATTEEQLAAHFAGRPPGDTAELADSAYTLAVGRRPFAVRRALVCGDPADAAACLAAGDPVRLLSPSAEAGGWPESGRPVPLVFPRPGAPPPRPRPDPSPPPPPPP